MSLDSIIIMNAYLFSVNSVFSLVWVLFIVIQLNYKNYDQKIVYKCHFLSSVILDQVLYVIVVNNKWQTSCVRECVSTGAVGAQTRSSLRHHLLHLLILRLLVLCAPADFENPENRLHLHPQIQIPDTFSLLTTYLPTLCLHLWNNSFTAIR